MDNIINAFPVPAFIWKKEDSDFKLMKYNLAAIRETNGEIKSYDEKLASELYESRNDIIQILDKCLSDKKTHHTKVDFLFKPGDQAGIFKMVFSPHPPDIVIMVSETNSFMRSDEQITLEQIKLEKKITERTRELQYINEVLKNEVKHRKLAEEQLGKIIRKEKELNLIKSRFISTVSHEFRTPLASIYSNAQLLEKYEEKWERTKKMKCIHRIYHSVENLSSMIENISLLGLKDNKKLTFKPEYIEIEQFFNDLTDNIIEVQLASHNIKLEYNCRQSGIHIDSKLMAHIYSNLLLNAIKYSPQGGEIQVDIGVYSDVLHVSIEDEGVGIHEKDLQHIFEPFYRGENTGDIKGTGLGMAIVKHAIDMHKGAIKINSRVGRGTRIEFTIPDNPK